MSAAGRRAVTHSQQHTDVPATWKRHVHRASHVTPKQPGLESSRLHCLGCPSRDGLSTSTFHDNQPAKGTNGAGYSHFSLNGTNYCNASSIAPLVSGVAGLSGSSHSKANKLNIWCKKTAACELLQAITETINTLFHVLNFFKNVLLQKSSCFHKVV